MTTAIMDRPSIFSPMPIRHILQQEVSNNTQLSPPVDTKAESKVLSNQSVDESTIDVISKIVTVKIVVPEEIEQQLSALIYGIKDQNFDDILESNLAKSLSGIINYNGDVALKLLFNWIVSKRVDATTIKEVVVLIGRIDGLEKQARRNFLELCLQVGSSARTRYAAILGLSYLDDPDAIPSVKSAIESEPLESMRKDMKQLLTQLEKTLLGK